MIDYKKGSLVTFNVIDRHYSEDGIAVNVDMRTSSNDTLTLCERINLDNFPSFDDYKGEYTEVKHADMAIVLRKVGRPFKIQQGKKWSSYDVYEVMTKNLKICQVFKYHIKLLENEN